MIVAKLRHRTGRAELLVVLGTAGMVALAGVAVARRFGSRVSDARRVARKSEAPGAPTPLVGHEFSFMGHTFHVLESARDTDDGALRFDYSAPPGANIPEHVHSVQEESFEVVSGKLGLRVGGQELTLTPGQSATGPPRVPHAWWNPSNEEEARFLVSIRPGLEAEIVFETVIGLMREGKTIGPVPKNPLQLAVLAREIASWTILTPVEKVLFAPVEALAFVGRILGYRTRYPEYSGPEARAEKAAVGPR